MTALRERGLRVPNDISMVSFDDIPEAAHFVPGLTTVRQDFHRMGRLATEFLVSMIESAGHADPPARAATQADRARKHPTNSGIEVIELLSFAENRRPGVDFLSAVFAILGR